MKLITEDYIMIGALIVQVVLRFVFVAAVYMLESVTSFVGVAQAVEANAILLQIMQLKGTAMIITVFLTPAFIVAVYWFFRKQYIKDRNRYQFVLPVFAVYMLMSSALNLCNDSAALLGLLLRVGAI